MDTTAGPRALPCVIAPSASLSASLNSWSAYIVNACRHIVSPARLKRGHLAGTNRGSLPQNDDTRSPSDVRRKSERKDLIITSASAGEPPVHARRNGVQRRRSGYASAACARIQRSLSTRRWKAVPACSSKVSSRSAHDVTRTTSSRSRYSRHDQRKVVRSFES